ncbi:glycosyltransferase, partial [Oligoflexia bacterium]|nr:glycosyltransferase [Oligoflexia bacterium]
AATTNFMAKVLILIGAHLCTAPRPQKEADALVGLGHDVTVGGLWFDGGLIQKDKLLLKDKPWSFKPIVDFSPCHTVTNFSMRVKKRLARERFKAFNHFTPELLGYGARAILKFALKTKADLTIVHSESGLWVGCQLLERGYKVGVDFEDWFSEDLLSSAREGRPVDKIKGLEKRLASTCRYCLTTSDVLAGALAKAYDAPKPTVVYNTFPWSEREQLDGKVCDRKDLTLPSIHWFSQTIGTGRGLETFYKALSHVDAPAEVHLRGSYPESARKALEPLLPSKWKRRLFIHGLVPNGELLSRIAEHDIGLALERTDIVSRDLSVTNKLFQYMQGGLALVATATAGQREVLSIFGAEDNMIPCDNPVALAEVLNRLLKDANQLASAKQASLKAAEETYCWEQQAPALERAFGEALK